MRIRMRNAYTYIKSIAETDKTTNLTGSSIKS